MRRRVGWLAALAAACTLGHSAEASEGAAVPFLSYASVGVSLQTQRFGAFSGGASDIGIVDALVNPFNLFWNFVSGEVIEVAVAANTPLKAGDVLFPFDPLPFQSAVQAVPFEVRARLVELDRRQRHVA